VSRPYDKTFKLSAEEDSRGLLDLLGCLPLEAEAQVEPLDREITQPALEVDHAYRIRTADADWIEHFEALARWESEAPERMTRYGASLWLKFSRPVRLNLVLLAERFAPAVVPNFCRLELDDLQIQTRFRVVRLWEIDAAKVLAKHRVALYPWVTLMGANPEHIRDAYLGAVRSGNRAWTAQFAQLGELRYGKEQWLEWLTRSPQMMPWAKIFKETHWYDMALSEGRQEEKAASVAKLRTGVRTAVRARFPDLGELPELDQVTDDARLIKLLSDLASANDIEAARRSVQSALHG
jgi:hypothetical protein